MALKLNAGKLRDVFLSHVINGTGNLRLQFDHDGTYYVPAVTKQLLEVATNTLGDAVKPLHFQEGNSEASMEDGTAYRLVVIGKGPNQNIVKLKVSVKTTIEISDMPMAPPAPCRGDSRSDDDDDIPSTQAPQECRSDDDM